MGWWGICWLSELVIFAEDSDGLGCFSFSIQVIVAAVWTAAFSDSFIASDGDTTPGFAFVTTPRHSFHVSVSGTTLTATSFDASS